MLINPCILHQSEKARKHTARQQPADMGKETFFFKSANPQILGLIPLSQIRKFHSLCLQICLVWRRTSFWNHFRKYRHTDTLYVMVFLCKQNFQSNWNAH